MGFSHEGKNKMNANLKIIKGGQKNASYRNSFNQLAKDTFSLDFEDWYQNGYWNSNYIPYSVVDGDKAIANVSVNPMDFLHRGKLKHFIQLGTVMTDKAFRNQGLIRELIKEIERDYAGRTEGYFLFANEKVLDFYPRFGFQRMQEYEYDKEVCLEGPVTAENVPMRKKEEWKRLEEAISSSSAQSDLWHMNQRELIMFYVTKFMSQSVYQLKEQKAWAIADLNHGVLHLYSVFSEQEADLEEIIRAFGSQVKKVILGFTPLQKNGYEWKEKKHGDTTLFVKGKELEAMEKEVFLFPELSHA